MATDANPHGGRCWCTECAYERGRAAERELVVADLGHIGDDPAALSEWIVARNLDLAMLIEIGIAMRAISTWLDTSPGGYRGGPQSEPPRAADWYSDEALAKQADLAALPPGEPPPVELLCGAWEPRTQPAPEERCVCCGLDARDQVSGEAFGGRRYCGICVGRGHHHDKKITPSRDLGGSVLDEATEATVTYVGQQPWSRHMAADVLRVAADRLRAEAIDERRGDSSSRSVYRVDALYRAADLLTEGTDR